MKIYISHSNNLNFRDDLYAPLKKSSLAKNHDFFLPHDGGRDINTKDVIKNSDLFIVEASLPSTGSGIEIGWADAAGVPILCISKIGAKISGSLRHLTKDFLEYSDSEDLLTQLEVKLK